MINYLAVLLATVAAFAVGALWYGPLFGKSWRKLMGIQEGSSMKGVVPAMVGGFISTLVLVYVLALFMASFPMASVLEAVHLSLLVSIGFIATTLLNSVWYENRPLSLYFINASHSVVALLAAALVLFYWG